MNLLLNFKQIIFLMEKWLTTDEQRAGVFVLGAADIFVFTGLAIWRLAHFFQCQLKVLRQEKKNHVAVSTCSDWLHPDMSVRDILQDRSGWQKIM